MASIHAQIECPRKRESGNSVQSPASGGKPESRRHGHDGNAECGMETIRAELQNIRTAEQQRAESRKTENQIGETKNCLIVRTSEDS